MRQPWVNQSGRKSQAKSLECTHSCCKVHTKFLLGEPQHEWMDEHEPLYPSKATPNVEKQFLKKLQNPYFPPLWKKDYF